MSKPETTTFPPTITLGKFSKDALDKIISNIKYPLTKSTIRDTHYFDDDIKVRVAASASFSNNENLFNKYLILIYKNRVLHSVDGNPATINHWFNNKYQSIKICYYDMETPHRINGPFHHSSDSKSEIVPQQYSIHGYEFKSVSKYKAVVL